MRGEASGGRGRRRAPPAWVMGADLGSGLVHEILPLWAEERLARACLSRPERCPRCAREELWRFGDGRRRCLSCRRVFRLQTGRWLARPRLSGREWCALIKCFELGLGPRETSAVSGLSRAAVRRGLRTLKACLGGREEGFDAVVEALAGYVPAGA